MTRSLHDLLANGPRDPKSTPHDAFALGVDWFNSGRRIEIQALATELSVSRITLHRWVGTRELLITEILWHLTGRAIDREVARVDRTPGRGSRVPIVMARIADRVVHNRGVRRMQTDELELLTRLTTRDASTYQQSLISRLIVLLDEDRNSGRLVASIPIADLAFATVRLTEAFVHTPAITGDPPAPDRLGPILHALLDP